MTKVSKKPTPHRKLRELVGEILVRNNLRTDQVAIGEIVALIEKERDGIE